MTYIQRQDDGPAAMERAADAMEFIDASDREIWLRIAMGLKSEFNDAGFAIWDDWSRSADNYNQHDAMTVWRGIKSGGGVGIGSLFHLARENGWRDDVTYTAATMTPEQVEQRRQARMQATAQAEAEIQQEQARAAKWAIQTWQQAKPVQSNPYLDHKQVSPTATIRQIDVSVVNEIIGYRLKSKGEELEGEVLVVPIRRAGSTVLCSLEFIDGTGRKTALAGRGTKSGGYWATERLDSPDILLAGEGVATVLSASQDAQLPAVAALSCGNLKSVAVAMREQYPNAKIIMLADLDKQTGEPDQHAIDAAKAVGGFLAVPDFSMGVQA
jgi:putative DNA primase/helicase